MYLRASISIHKAPLWQQFYMPAPTSPPTCVPTRNYITTFSPLYQVPPVPWGMTGCLNSGSRNWKHLPLMLHSQLLWLYLLLSESESNIVPRSVFRQFCTKICFPAYGTYLAWSCYSEISFVSCYKNSSCNSGLTVCQIIPDPTKAVTWSYKTVGHSYLFKVPWSLHSKFSPLLVFRHHHPVMVKRNLCHFDANVICLIYAHGFTPFPFSCSPPLSHIIYMCPPSCFRCLSHFPHLWCYSFHVNFQNSKHFTHLPTYPVGIQSSYNTSWTS